MVPYRVFRELNRKVRVDLRLQRLQFRLRDQVLHLHVAQLLDMFGDGGAQARQHGEVFAKITPSAAPRPEQEVGRVAAQEAHGQQRLHPCGDFEVRRIEHRDRRRERDADGGIPIGQVVAGGMQESGDGLGRQAQVFRFRRGERQVLQFVQRLLHVGAQEKGAGQQALDAIVSPHKQRQQEAGGDKDHAGVEGVLQMRGEEPRLQDADGRQQRGGRQRGVHDEAQEGVHEQEAVILEQDQQGQRQARVMQRRLPRPHQLPMGGAEVRERDGKQKQAHGAGQPGSGRAVLLTPFENYGEDGEGGKPNGHHQQRGVVQAVQVAEPVRQVERHGHAAQDVTGDPKRAAARLQRDVQQHRRKQAQDGKAEGHDGAGDLAGARTSGQRHEGPQIPEHRQGGGHRRQTGALLARAPAVHQEEVQQHPEDYGAGRVADGVDENRLVNAQPVGHGEAFSYQLVTCPRTCPPSPSGAA